MRFYGHHIDVSAVGLYDLLHIRQPEARTLPFIAEEWVKYEGKIACVDPRSVITDFNPQRVAVLPGLFRDNLDVASLRQNFNGI